MKSMANKFGKLYNILQDEKERCSEYNCKRVSLDGISKMSFPLVDCIRWIYTKKHIEHLVPMIHSLAENDEYTEMHSERVALMTYRFCLLTDMNKFCVKLITLSAYCHDIGKTRVSKEILNKAGRLTDDEFNEIKKHPGSGAEMLGDNLTSGYVSDGVLCHQERWDGKGYPNGLSGDNIPLVARIIAVADSIDAMMSDRPYRKALSADECKAEIIKNREIMYDKRIADIYLENWEYMVDNIYEKHK